MRNSMSNGTHFGIRTGAKLHAKAGNYLVQFACNLAWVWHAKWHQLECQSACNLVSRETHQLKPSDIENSNFRDFFPLCAPILSRSFHIQMTFITILGDVVRILYNFYLRSLKRKLQVKIDYLNLYFLNFQFLILNS